MGKFYAKHYIILSRIYTKISSCVKCILFKFFCSNMYCFIMWCEKTGIAMRKLRIASNSLRRLLGLPKYNSAGKMFV